MSKKRWIQIGISALVACAVIYIYMQQPSFQKTLPKEHILGWKVFAYIACTVCLTMYGYFINSYVVYPLFKTLAPYISPKLAHEAYFYRALSFYRQYQKGEIPLEDLAGKTLVGTCNEEKEAAYMLFSLMDMQPEVLLKSLPADKRDLVRTGLEQASKRPLWLGVYIITGITTAIVLIALVLSFSTGKAILLPFVGLILKHAASKLA